MEFLGFIYWFFFSFFALQSCLTGIKQEVAKLKTNVSCTLSTYGASFDIKLWLSKKKIVTLVQFRALRLSPELLSGEASRHERGPDSSGRLITIKTDWRRQKGGKTSRLNAHLSTSLSRATTLPLHKVLALYTDAGKEVEGSTFIAGWCERGSERERREQILHFRHEQTKTE